MSEVHELGEIAGRSVQLHRAGPTDVLVLADWCDLHLQGDYFFKRRHLEGICKRPTSKAFVVLIDSVMGGIVVLYKDSVLHNLYLSPEYRTGGIGTRIVQYLRPQVIRAKSNMLAGDPTQFYQQNGYDPVTVDANRQHIVEMHRRPDAGVLPATNAPAPQAPPRPPAPPAAQVSRPETPVPIDPPEAPVESEIERQARLWRERQRRQIERRQTKKAATKAAASAVGIGHVLAAQSRAANGSLPEEW